MSVATETCPDCDGAGWITYNPSLNRDPQLERERPCRTCGGGGLVDAQTIEDRRESEAYQRTLAKPPVSAEDFANPDPQPEDEEWPPF